MCSAVSENLEPNIMHDSKETLSQMMFMSFILGIFEREAIL
jgi:hypothetical protein